MFLILLMQMTFYFCVKISKVSRLWSQKFHVYVSKIGLSLNVEKCEFVVFNNPTSSNAPLACRGFFYTLCFRLSVVGYYCYEFNFLPTAVHCS